MENPNPNASQFAHPGYGSLVRKGTDNNTTLKIQNPDAIEPIKSAFT